MLDYKYILLDADGTFLNFPPCEEIAIKALLEFIGIGVSEYYTDSYNKINKATWKALEEGKITLQELKSKRIKDFFDAHDIGFDVETARVYFEEELSKNGILYPGAYELLDKLNKDYTLVLITNGIANVQRGRLSSSDTTKFFSKLFISEEIGYSKPNINFFKSVLANLDCDAKDCLIIGDSVAADIAGGNSANIDTLYLHLDSQYNGAECTYHASNYKEVLDIIYTV